MEGCASAGGRGAEVEGLTPEGRVEGRLRRKKGGVQTIVKDRDVDVDEEARRSATSGTRF